ncbi:MAG: hypothetical protein QM747_12550 [Nocardioides sp.]
MSPPRLPAPLLKAGADATLPTVRLARRVRRLEEGVRENALLAVPLEEQVARIEQSLVPALEVATSRAARGSSVDTQQETP